MGFLPSLLFIIIGVCLVAGSLVSIARLRRGRGAAFQNELPPPSVTSLSTPLPQKQEEIYRKETTYPPRPRAPAHKIGSYLLGLILILIGPFMLFTGNGPFMLLGVGSVIGGIYSIIAASHADKREAENVGYRATAVEEEGRHEVALINKESARDNAELQKILNTKIHETNILRQGLEQKDIGQRGREIDLRNTLIPQARERGLDVDRSIEASYQEVINQLEVDKINKLNKAETDKQWTEIQNWLQGANLVAQAKGQQRKTLTQDFIDTVNQIADTKRKRLPREEKTRILDQLEDNLTAIREDINALKTEAGRHLQAINREAAGRLQELNPNAGSDYPDGVDADDH